MKQQVSRLSPHQNGKVFGVLMAVSSLVVIVPFFLIFSATVPAGVGGPPAFMILIMPIMYLVVGYLSVAIGCAVYNFMFKYIGGIEYEAKSEAAA